MRRSALPAFGAVAVSALTGIGQGAGSREAEGSTGRADSPRAGADPTPTKPCPVFPPPGPEVAADAPSLPDQRAWNQNISQAPVEPKLRRGPRIHRRSRRRRAASGLRHLEEGRDPGRGRRQAHGQGRGAVHRRRQGVRRGAVPAAARLADRGRGQRRRRPPRDRLRQVALHALRALQRRPGERRWTAFSGSIWDLSSAELRRDGYTSADAAGLPIYPGLVRHHELTDDSLDRAIRITFESTRNAWIHPGSHCAGDTDNPAAPPMGMRMRLRADFETSALSGDALTIAEALKAYGVIVADNGSNWFLSGSSDRRFSNGNLNQLKQIPVSEFEVVRSEAETHVC